LIEAKGDETEITLTLDQQKDRFSSGLLCLVDLGADFSRALNLFLCGFHDQVARAHTFGGSRAVLGHVDDDDAFRIASQREFLLEIRGDARKRQAQRLDDPGLVLGGLLGGILRARLLLIALL